MKEDDFKYFLLFFQGVFCLKSLRVASSSLFELTNTLASVSHDFLKDYASVSYSAIITEEFNSLVSLDF